MSLITQEMQKLSGREDISVDTSIHLGTLAMATHLEEVAPATARQLYLVGHELQEYELRLNQETQTNQALRRMLEAHEYDRPEMIFKSMDDATRLGELRRGFTVETNKFFQFKRDKEFMDNLLEQAERLLRPAEVITLRAITETDDTAYLGDFDRMFRHMDAISKAQSDIQYLEFIVPLYVKVREAFEELDSFCGINFNKLNTIIDMPIITIDSETEQATIDHEYWSGCLASRDSTPSDMIDKFMRVNLKKFMIDNFGHANIDGLNRSCLTSITPHEISDKNYALLQEIVNVYIFLNEE